MLRISIDCKANINIGAYSRGSYSRQAVQALDHDFAPDCVLKNPAVKLITKVYEKGVSLTKKAMKKYEKIIKRLPGLEKWFVDILCFAE